jgi:hypothetical protein
VPPTPTPAPRTYVVQAGDTLSGVCATELSDLPRGACVDLIVEMSGLDGPDAIYEGQSLKLPGASAPSGTPPTRRTPAATPTLEAAEPEATATVEVEPEPTQAFEEPTATSEPVTGVLTPLSRPDQEAGTPDEGEPDGGSNAEADETPQGETDGALVPMLGEFDVEGATLPHDFDMSNAHLYTVEPGETILSICLDQYPDLAAGECIGIIVALNGLGGADEIFANQGILLP